MSGALASGPESAPVSREYELGNYELPIAEHRAEIENALENNAVTIVVSRTGSGKTTQIPQYALEMVHEGEPFFDKVHITQPRIVSARSVSERVQYEVDGSKSSRRYSIGYTTGRESSVLPQKYQNVTFITDGKMAAQMLYEEPDPECDHQKLLIIDEMHERNEHIDLLLAIAKQRTDPRSPNYDKNLKVLIMSATLDSDRLVKYFDHSTPPVIEVDVPTHPVELRESRKSVASVALQLAQESQQKVLAFLPGKREIERTKDFIESKSLSIHAVALHGQQTKVEQSRAFKDYPSGAVIATTNAAETSLTVPGAYAVVDSGKVRVDRIDYSLVPNGSEGLYLEDAAQANLRQRQGRVGRTGPGVYVLASPDGRDNPTPFDERPEYAPAAIERSRLDSMVLRLKSAGHEITDFDFYETPFSEAIDAATNRLVVLNALTKDGAITPRGKEMSKLPLDPEYACMVAYAFERGYSDEVKQSVIDIAAIMQLGGILKRSPREQRWRELLATDPTGDPRETESDFFAQHEAYSALINKSKKEWSKYDVNEYAASTVEDARSNIASRLGFEMCDVEPVRASHRETIMTCIGAGQLNQLWQQDGDGWRLVVGNSERYEQAESSVVRSIGQLATGSLFSLGLGKETIHRVQNLNRVKPAMLEQIAGHLITEKRGSIAEIEYDQNMEWLTIPVERSLGRLTLGFRREAVKVESGSVWAENLSRMHQAHKWNEWDGKNNVTGQYTDVAAIDALLESGPEFAIYGIDVISGKDLTAWKGGQGKWHMSRSDAIKSLEARKKALLRIPDRMNLREQKAEIKVLSTQLRALKKSGINLEDAKKIDALDKPKNATSKTEWIKSATALRDSIINQNNA